VETVSELISFASAILQGGLDFEAFWGWKASTFFALLSLAGSFHCYAAHMRRSAETGRDPLVAGKAIILAAQETLLSWANAFEANSLPAGIGPTSILPLDLSLRRIF